MLTYAKLTERYEKVVEERANLLTNNLHYINKCKQLEAECERLKGLLAHFGMLLDAKIHRVNITDAILKDYGKLQEEMKQLKQDNNNLIETNIKLISENKELRSDEE